MILELGGADIVGRRVEPDAVLDVNFRHQSSLAA
jgi:hypothetical protein